MILTQRQIHHGVFGLVTVGGLLLLISSLATALNTREIATILIGTVLSGGLWIAYWRGWGHARLAVVILVTLLTALGIQNVSRDYDILIFIAPVMALILTQPGWMVASAVTILGILLFRADGTGVYASTSNLIEFAVIIAGLVLCRKNLFDSACCSFHQANRRRGLSKSSRINCFAFSSTTSR